MKQIVTIQHTQSQQHVNGMMGSWSDWDLTELGIAQAKNIGERLAHELENERYAIYSSDLLRTRHTAEIVAGSLGITPNFTEALREFNLGEAVGQTKEWARERRRPWNTIDDRPYTGAESKREVWHRLSVFLQQLMNSEDERLIIVSHGGTLGIFHALWLGVEVEALNKFYFSGAAGSVSFLREDPNGMRAISRLYDGSYIN